MYSLRKKVEAPPGGREVSDDIARDTFKALQKAQEAFEASMEHDGWDAPLELIFEARELDIEGRTLRRIILSNEEKVKP